MPATERPFAHSASAFPLGPWRALPPWGRSLLGLLACIVAAGLASIALRQDSSWDLMNYHYYNAWAFVHGRHGIDLAPAQLQTFHNPFLDLPFYALVAADVPPRAIAFVLAVPTGIAWYCFARIVTTLFAPLEAGGARAGDRGCARDRRHRADVGEPHRHHDERLVRGRVRAGGAVARGARSGAVVAHDRARRIPRGPGRGIEADRQPLCGGTRGGGVPRACAVVEGAVARRARWSWRESSRDSPSRRVRGWRS